ncbi:hypothetical protein EVAR_74896_1 [Eumeta japonica]|uniref:(+)RNA virus helicase C-terminal domain-containing protein n=1 Tax=Eumeta variegata TaxID=151549 RepID=A0A4C1Z3L2_EUMVA|nr:hypothetical protein EVAR_74896_1 [Eumeta japonica]
MASVLVNGFQRPKSCDQLIADEALMSHFEPLLWRHGLRVEKESLITQGVREGEGTRFLTIHKAQSLTSEGTVIVRIAAKYKIHDSVSHAVVAITRHTVSCVYHTEDGEHAIGRFIRRAVAASENKIKDNNAKIAIRNRDKRIMNVHAENWKQ